MKRNLALLSCLFLGASLICLVSFYRIGSTVDAHGTLREPFALIPLGYASGFAALLSGLVALVLPGKQRGSKS